MLRRTFGTTDKPYVSVSRLLSLALAIGALTLLAEPVSAFTCRGGGPAQVCIVIELINNPAYVHFRIVNASSDAHYNIRDNLGQREIRPVHGAATGTTYVQRGTNPSIQRCTRGTFGSNCGPWYVFDLSTASLPPPAPTPPSEPAKPVRKLVKREVDKGVVAQPTAPVQQRAVGKTGVVSQPSPLHQRAAAGNSGSTCKPGFVWRVARASDLVCVTPQSRQRAYEETQTAAARIQPGAAPNCRSGYVWRAAFSGDLVCVTPQVRALVAEENRLGASRRAP